MKVNFDNLRLQNIAAVHRLVENVRGALPALSEDQAHYLREAMDEVTLRAHTIGICYSEEDPDINDISDKLPEPICLTQEAQD